MILLSTEGRLSRTRDYSRTALGRYGKYEIVRALTVNPSHYAVTLVPRSAQRISSLRYGLLGNRTTIERNATERSRPRLGLAYER